MTTYDLAFVVSRSILRLEYISDRLVRLYRGWIPQERAHSKFK
jgi:hypothetical protein